MQAMVRFLRATVAFGTVRWLLVACLCLGFRGSADADGKVFPPRAYPAEVTIPDQTAVVVWSEGVQRLVIETRFVGEGTNFAWVIPLPSQPVIEAASAGLFTTLRHSFQPDIKHHVANVWAVALLLGGLAWLGLTVRRGGSISFSDLAGMAAFAVGIGVVVEASAINLSMAFASFMVAFFATLAVRRGVQPVYVILVGGAIVAVLGAMLLPALAKGTANVAQHAEPGVRVLASERVGVYETTTVAATDPAALPRWLDENGFVLTPGSQPVIEQYAREGWVFVAAKVNREDAGRATSAPHPLSFTFPADQPVYPLRLTGVGGDELAVELYVFGPGRAYCNGFAVAECHEIQFPPTGSWRNRPSPSYVGHPVLREWVTDARVVTKLAATLKAFEMIEDALISWQPFERKRFVVFSHVGARSIALNLGVSFTVGVMLCLGGWRALRPSKPAPWGKRFLLAVGAGVVLTATTYAALPKIEVRLDQRGGFAPRSALHHVCSMLERRLPRERTPTITEVRAAFQQLAPELEDTELRNGFTGEPIREDDSPGNFTLRETERGVEFVAHDATGAGHVVTVFSRW